MPLRSSSPANCARCIHRHNETAYLAELARRYRGHPGAAESMWSGVNSRVSPNEFRGHSPYVWQRQPDHAAYRRSYEELAERQRTLAARAHEDGAFGARCEDVNGKSISRDLLDSVAELGFLESCLDGGEEVEILDIGAGYGRLGHRVDELAPSGWRIRCVDGIPMSTYLCARYLEFRGTRRATTVALDEIEESVARKPVMLACNIHSFPELPLAAIAWWLRLLAEHAVPLLFLVPNVIADLRSAETNGSRHDFRPLLARYGYRLIATAPKYKRASLSSDDPSVVFQDLHMLFAR